MGRRGPFRVGSLALLVIFVAQQTLAKENVCRSGCRGAPQIFKYTPGTTYKYNYEGKIEVTLSSSTEGQVSSTEVKAVVLLTQLPDCNQLIRLQNVQIIGQNGKKYGSIPDVEKPIRINFNDGHIEDSICTDPADTQNSLNIKRAIASIFQVNLKKSYETDVFGVCPTETVQRKEDGIVVIQKSRDLNKCAYRENIRQDFFSPAFNLHSEIKSSPILNGDYSSKLKIRNGVLDQANIVENYLYVPFSVGANGAKAQIVTKLQLTGSSNDNPGNTVNKPRSIIFENPHPVTTTTSNVNNILNAVKEVIKTIDIVVGEQTAKEFLSLIKTIRSSNKNDLLAVYNQVRSGIGLADKTTAKRVFLDALLEAGTGEAAEVAITLLKNNELSELEKNFVYYGLSLVRHATESSLVTAAGLLSQKNLPYDAYLGVGNLAGQYCRQHSCDKVEAVNKLTQKLIQKLGDGKAANKQEENEMIYALKALGNFGYLTDVSLQKLISIAQDKQAPNRLRVVALETYLTDACKDKLQNSALNILQDIQQDSEVRIKAYLVVAQCPNAKIGNAVKALLAKEPSYQVGGFIASHIRNLKASANPDKTLAREYLGFSLPKKFPIDPRKWSYNGEFSYAVDTLGIAATAEANVIYSQDSFLPRSSSLNLTTELFGHTVNLLEIQTRQENLDKLVEHYFGPKGVFRTSSLGDLLKYNQQFGKKITDYLQDKLKDILRRRRDVSRSEIEKIGNAVQIKENLLNKDLDVDLGVKAFGSEILFTNLNIYQHGLTPESVIDKIIESFAQGLDKLKNFKETLRTNFVLLDVEFDYPTGLGFPLRLAAEGVANLQVNAESNINLRALIGGKDTKVHAKLIPSANIEISGRLTLDALVIENGLKVASTLYTATGGDVNINIFNNQHGIDLKFGLPVQEQKLLSAKHEIVFHTREQSGHESNSPVKFAQGKDFSICLDQLNPFIGLTFCAELNGPNLAGKQTSLLPFPLAGDAVLSVSIENEDLSEIHIKDVINNQHTNIELVIETIGKNNQKKVSFNLNAEISPEKYVKIVLNSPIKTAHAEARFTTNEREVSFLVKLGYDQTEFYGKAGVAISRTPQQAVYKPILEYKAPGGNQQFPVSVEGQIVEKRAGSNSKYIFDNIQIALPNNKVLTLTGDTGNDGPSSYIDLTLSDGKQSGTFKGRTQLSSELGKYNIELQNTINPIVNFNLKGEYKLAEGHNYNSFQLIHGGDLSSKVNIISFTSDLTRKFESAQDFTFGVKEKFTYPLLGISLELEIEQKPKRVQYDFDVQYNEIKFGSELEMEINKKERGDFELEFEIYGLENKVEFKASRQVHGEESKINNELEVNGQKLEVKGKIKHHIQPSNVDVGADLTVVLPTHKTPFKVNSGLKYVPSEFDAHHKVTSGSTVVVDVFIKANKHGNANGSIKVNIKNILVVNGQLKAVKGTGTGELLIDAQSIKKQVKFESKYQIQPCSVYNIDLTIYPSFVEDQGQKVILSTHNKLSANSVDSKNSLSLLGKKLSLNVNGQKTGDLQNGKLNGELEIILPNDQYLLGKLNRDFKQSNDLLNGEAVASLEYRRNKNTAGRKVSIKGTYKNTNPNEGLYDVVYNLAADDSNGKNVNADINFKSTKQGEERLLEVGNKIYGSILNNPLSAYLNLRYKSLASGSYEATASYGPNSNVKVKGKVDGQGQGKPISGDIEIQLATPSKKLKTLKASTSGSFLKPQSPSDPLDVYVKVNIFADDDGTVADPIIDLNGEGQIKASDKDGEIKGTLKYGKLDPITATAGYSHIESGKKKQLNGNIALQYGQGKNFKLEGSLQKPDDHQYKLEVDIETPSENLKKGTLSVHTTRSEDNRHISNVVLTADGKVWTSDSELHISEITPLIKFKAKNPDGKISLLYLKGNKISENEFSGEIKIQSETRNVLIESALNAKVESNDEFDIKLKFNSPNLGLNKISAEVQNKPAKGDRKIQVTVTSAGKNLLSGSANYQSREEHGKYIIDGSGTFKVKDESKSGNFKFIRRLLTAVKDGEQGMEISFDGTVGNKAVDADWRITNKNFRSSVTLCEKTKDCAHITIDSKISRNDVNNYHHVLEISSDLRKFGVPHQSGLKSVTSRKNYVIDHTVDIYFQSPENYKYQYSVYFHPKEAGVTLSTPKRIVSLEGTLQIPENVKQGEKVSGEIAFFLDKKNQPSKKASVSGWIAVDVPRKSVNTEIQLLHPGLQRPLTASIKTVQTGTDAVEEVTVTSELDLFNEPSQKVTSTYKYSHDISSNKAAFKDSVVIRSAGLGIDLQYSQEGTFDRQSYGGDYSAKVKYHIGSSNYDSELSINGGKTQFSLLVKALNIELLKINNKLSLSKEEQIINSEISSYNKNPLISHLEVKNFNTLLYTVYFKNNPREKLQFNAGLIPGQVADVRSDHVTGAGKTNLFHATVKLDEANFLKPDYSINSKEIEKVLEIIKNKFTDYVNGLQNVGKEWSNDIRKEVTQVGEISKKATPNLQPLRDYYTTEIQKAKDEILEDKYVKEFADVTKNLFGALIQSLSEIFGKLSEIVEASSQSIQKAFAGVIDSIDKELIPELKQLAEKLIAVATDLSKAVVEITAGYLATISQVVEKYQPEIKQLAATFGELGKDVGRFIQKSYEQVRLILTNLARKIYNEIQALPIFDEIKAQYQDFLEHGLPNKEGIIGGIREIAATAKDIVPPDFVIQKEIVEIIDLTVQYIEKKLKQEPVDDFAVFDKIVGVYVSLIKKLITAVSTPTYDVTPGYTPVSFDFLKKLPKLVAVKFSPIAYVLRNDPTEEIIGFLLSILNHPKHWFAPFPLFGVVAQGQHIFTFDGKHLTFPANCKYLFARDAVNGNFTIVGTYSNGELSAFTLADQHDSITLKKGGQVLLNGAATELPVRKPDIAAYRSYQVIFLRSTAGVLVHCAPDLILCTVQVSGFYHAQLKGLLGVGNNEPYDDFTVPNGKIVTSEEQFGNAYKIGNCPQVTVPKHDHQTNEACNKLFDWESPLRYCYPFVNSDNFKQACVHGLAANVKDTEEAVAKAYVAACHQRNIPITVPPELLRCVNSETPFNVGDKFSVKLPAKSADVVLLVDTVKSNEQIYKDLLQPVVVDIVKTLQAKGINDVEFHLIAYGGENQWPSHVTVGGKLTFKGKAPTLKFSDAPKKEPIPEGSLTRLKPYLETLESVLHDLKLAFGLHLEAETYQEGIQYPFRANAVKSIVVLTSRPCDVGKLYILQRLRTLLYDNNQISLNLITPFEGFSLRNNKNADDVIGFNNEHVFTLSQAKKKPDGTAELYKELTYDDYCADFSIKTRGNVFLADNFHKASDKKLFVHTVAHNIVEQLVNVEQGLDCECKLINSYRAQNICRDAYTKEKPKKA